jgi:hypothetical protein
LRNIFYCKSVDYEAVNLKILFGSLSFDKVAAKFKMASVTCTFVILLSKLQFSTDFKCIQSVFLLSNFCRIFFSKIQNGGIFEDDVIFEKTFPPTSTFFLNFSKSNIIEQRPNIKKLPIFSKMEDIFKMAFVLFFDMKINLVTVF